MVVLFITINSQSIAYNQQITKLIITRDLVWRQIKVLEVVRDLKYMTIFWTKTNIY